MKPTKEPTKEQIDALRERLDVKARDGLFEHEDVLRALIDAHEQRAEPTRDATTGDTLRIIDDHHPECPRRLTLDQIDQFADEVIAEQAREPNTDAFDAYLSPQIVKGLVAELRRALAERDEMARRLEGARKLLEWWRDVNKGNHNLGDDTDKWLAENAPADAPLPPYEGGPLHAPKGDKAPKIMPPADAPLPVGEVDDRPLLVCPVTEPAGGCHYVTCEDCGERCCKPLVNTQERGDDTRYRCVCSECNDTGEQKGGA